MKKLITFTFLLFFSAGMAFGQSQIGQTIGEALNEIQNLDLSVLGAEGAFITQTGDNNTADITQNGNTNGATILQQGPGSEATINQTGVENKALISQTVGNDGGSAGGNKGTITQNGDRNFAVAVSSPRGVGFDHTTTISQVGDDNIAGQLLLDRDNVHMSISQEGDGNIAGQLANGRYLFGEITQSGDNNMAGQLFVGDGSADPYWEVNTILQDGDSNLALQIGSGNSPGWGLMTIEQTGNSNQAFQYMNGDYTANTLQSGDNNMAVITQGTVSF